MQILSLDPVHLAMTYEHCHFNKRTPGSRVLRLIMAKFAKHDHNLTANYWGRIYDGLQAGLKPPLEDDRLRTLIMDHSMPTATASV